jgi:hypothetical protein
MRYLTSIILLAFLPVLTATTPPRADVQPPAARLSLVEKAQRLSEVPPVPPVREELRNPFMPPLIMGAAVTTSQVVAPVVVSDRRILDAIAPRVNPTGTVTLGGEPILLFGQKRIKVGDVLPITFEGRSYSLVISAIQSTSFTVRLNNEETTRPINPASRP